MKGTRLLLTAGLAALVVLLALAVGSNGPAGGGTAQAKALGHETVVVKFVEGSGVRLRGGQLRDASGNRLTGVANAVLRHSGQLERLFSRSESDLAADKQRGEARSGKPLPDLNLFYGVQVPSKVDAEALAAELTAQPSVENAYVYPEPAPLPATPDFEPQQTYLDAPPNSIGARTAWQLPGGRGAGVLIADVEYCWNTSHEDLSKATSSKILPMSGHTQDCLVASNDPDGRQHGTSVLGEMIADNNGFGVTGIASDADIRLAPSLMTDGYFPADAINRGAAAVGAGNLVLIEQQTQGAHGGCDSSGQTGCVALEYLDDVFAAIQTATASGVIVVEAAGNGSEDLDSPDYGGKFDRSVRDSGAIIVGAGWPPGLASTECAEAGNACVARSKIGFSTYGSRVDVQGWGTAIVTTGYGGLQGPDNSNTAYTAGFGGTSGASPIVTGSAAIIQGTLLARGAPTLGPGDMRALLTSTGSPQQDSINYPAASNHIGPLPDLPAALPADLQVTKWSTPNPVVAGEPLYYSITVTNNGPNFAPDVSVTDTLPAQVTFAVDSEDICTEGPAGTLTCDFGDLAAGASRTTVVRVSVHSNTVALAGGVTNISNTATVSSPLADPIPENNSVTKLTMVEDSADLRVTKLCKPDSQKLLAGETGTCTIFVDNLGPSDARSVQLTDTNLSNGAFTIGTITASQGTCSESDNVITCDLGTLPAASPSVSGRATVAVEVTATEEIDINDVATVVAETPDPDMSNNQAESGLQVTAVADIEVCKVDTAGAHMCTGDASGLAGPDPVVAGENLTYEMEITNIGPSDATNVVVEDALPAEVEVVSVVSSTGSCVAGTPGDPNDPTTCNEGTMIPGESHTIRITVRVKPNVLGLIHNDARAISDVFDPDTSNNLSSAATTVEGKADLSIAKADFPDPAVAGAGLTYELTVVNNGPSDAVGVVVEDTLPAEVVFQSATLSNGSGTCVLLDVPPNTVSCQLDTLPPNVGSPVLIYIHVLVKSDVPGGTSINDEAAVTSSTPDPDPANNASSQSTLVNAEADLEVLKDANFETGNPSTTIIYTITVNNLGPSDAQEVTVVDTLPLTPKKVVYVFDTANGACAYDKGTHTVSCDFGTLAAGESITFNIHVQTKGSLGTITNTVTADSSTNDPDESNNTASKDMLVKGGSGKTGGPGGGRGR